MNSQFMQMEPVRGVKPEGGIPSPRPLEAPAKKTLESMGYGDSAMKCNSCNHYDSDNSVCLKTDGETTDPEGHCAEYESGGGEMPDEAEAV